MSVQNEKFWKSRFKINAVLDPVDRISEILFGLIMVLTFTGVISVSRLGRTEVGDLLWEALACNLAWGFVDAIMYLMSVLLERGHSLKMINELKKQTSEKGVEILKSEITPLLAATLTDAEFNHVFHRITKLELPKKTSLLISSDFYSAFQIFILVFLCTLPVAVPFAILKDINVALMISNAIAILMLFGGGIVLARYSGFRPFITAIIYSAIGLCLIAVTKALGG